MGFSHRYGRPSRIAHSLRGRHRPSSRPRAPFLDALIEEYETPTDRYVDRGDQGARHVHGAQRFRRAVARPDSPVRHCGSTYQGDRANTAVLSRRSSVTIPYRQGRALGPVPNSPWAAPLPESAAPLQASCSSAIQPSASDSDTSMDRILRGSRASDSEEVAPGARSGSPGAPMGADGTTSLDDIHDRLYGPPLAFRDLLGLALDVVDTLPPLMLIP